MSRAAVKTGFFDYLDFALQFAPAGPQEKEIQAKLAHLVDLREVFQESRQIWIIVLNRPHSSVDRRLFRRAHDAHHATIQICRKEKVAIQEFACRWL
jgi:hypothetical protein